MPRYVPESPAVMVGRSRGDLPRPERDIHENFIVFDGHPTAMASKVAKSWWDSARVSSLT